MGEVIDFVLEFIGDIIDFFDWRKKRKTVEKDKIEQAEVSEKNRDGKQLR